MSWLLDVLWKLECRFNRRIPLTPAALSSAGFRACGASVDVLHGAQPTSGRPELCIVVMTHARAKLCADLLEALHASVRAAGVADRAFVLVMEDVSDHDYSAVSSTLERLFGGRFAYYRSPIWLGKRGRSGVFQATFDAIRVLQPAATLFIEDDIAIEPTFVQRSLDLWREIDDPHKAILYLVAFDDDEAEGRWIQFRRQPLPGDRIRLTQWFDLAAFLAGPSFFELLHHEVFPAWSARWRNDPSRSCGTSEQFTRRLFGRANVYQVCSSLGFHGGTPSLLNPEARVLRPFDNRPIGSGGQHAK